MTAPGLRDRLIDVAAAALAARVNPNRQPGPGLWAVYRADAAAMLAAVLPLLADEIDETDPLRKAQQ